MERKTSNVVDNKQKTTKKYEDMKTNIINNIVVPNLERDAKILSIWRIRWRNMANLFEALVKIMIGISTILAYSSGYYQKPVLAYYSGLTGTIALVFGEFSSYCKKESHERTNLFNRLLKHLGIDTVPDTTEDETNIPDEHNNQLNLGSPNTNLPNQKTNIKEHLDLEMSKIIYKNKDTNGDTNEDINNETKSNI
jgi:hypothetical protein